MAEAALTEIFPGATQDLNSVTIPKSSLATLTAASVNKGDAISAALLISLKNFYTAERRTAEPLTSIVAEVGRPSVDINFESGLNYLNRPLEFSLYSELNLPDLDADSY